MGLNRSDTILKYIVEYFIKHAEPVGSKTLISEYNLPFSSATIRNEMYDLEQKGYIEKPHTSSGRVPSSKGYRYYCEHLRQGGVDEQLRYSLQQVLQGKIKSVEETIKASCEILSHMTNLVSVVLGPDEKEERLANVQLIPISEKTVTSVFVTDKGYVENKTFIVYDNVNIDDLIKCVQLINDRLKGTPVIELADKMEALKPVLTDYITGSDLIYQALLETFIRFASDRLSLYGREELFKHKEFSEDASKLKQVLKLLSDKSVFKEVGNNDDELSLHIGDIENNPDVSLISAKIKLGDENNTIALVGPTRVDYEKVISAIEYVANELSEYFKKMNEGEDEKEGGDKDGDA